MIKAGRATEDAAGNVRQLTRDLYELSKQRATPVVDLNDAKATAKLDDVRARLLDLGRRAASAQVDVNDKDAVAKLAALRLRLDDLGKKVVSPRITVEGTARAEAQLFALDAQLDKLGSSADKAAGPSGLGALSTASGGGAMGYLIGAGVLLAPVVSTLAVGLTGLAAAAY